MEGVRVVDAVGLFPGNEEEASDARKAYTQSFLTGFIEEHGLGTWVE